MESQTQINRPDETAAEKSWRTCGRALLTGRNSERRDSLTVCLLPKPIWQEFKKNQGNLQQIIGKTSKQNSVYASQCFCVLRLRGLWEYLTASWTDENVCSSGFTCPASPTALCVCAWRVSEITCCAHLHVHASVFVVSRRRSPSQVCSSVSSSNA